MCRKTLRKLMRDMPYDFKNLLTAPYVKAIYEEIGYYLDGIEEEAWSRVRLPEKIREKHEIIPPAAPPEEE